MRITKSLGLYLVALAAANTPLSPATACTTVEIPRSKEKIVAKSYDWDQGHGMAFVNLSGIAKKAVPMKPGDDPAPWVAKYGSVTFNQHGREFPLGGMNEKGLVVEIMWLNGSGYPPADKRKSVNELQWIQYQLDQHASLAEVEKNADAIRVSNVYAEVHYMVCDASGACGTFEYIGGKLVVHSGASLPYPTLTNNTYSDSKAYYAGFPGRATPSGESSLARFVRATSLAAGFDPAGSVSSVDAAFSILDSVGGTSYTKFHIVYDPTNKVVRFRTLTHSTIKSVDLAQFDFACAKDRDKTLLYDMNQSDKGDVSKSFKPYSVSENRKLIREGLADVESHLPPGTADKLAAYPSALPCL